MNNNRNDIRRTVLTAMFAALILLATSVLKIQTPSFGYIHPGDAFVLLAGLLLGPVFGGLAAGIGSALADFLGGYAVWVPGTFVIKFLCAAAAAQIFRRLKPSRRRTASVIAAGTAGEVIMVAGYFFYNVLITAFSAGGFSAAGIAAALSVSLAGIPFNIVQGVCGILLVIPLLPVFSKILQTSGFNRQIQTRPPTSP